MKRLLQWWKRRKLRRKCEQDLLAIVCRQCCMLDPYGSDVGTLPNRVWFCRTCLADAIDRANLTASRL